MTLYEEFDVIYELEDIFKIRMIEDKLLIEGDNIYIISTEGNIRAKVSKPVEHSKIIYWNDCIT